MAHAIVAYSLRALLVHRRSGLPLPSLTQHFGPPLCKAMLHRFLLTMLPHPDLSEKVIAMRTALYARIGSFSGRHTPPHLTLSFLDLPEACGPAIMDAMASGTASSRSFMLHYNGINHFPDKRTIYIDPVERAAIAEVRAPIVAALHADRVLREAIRETVRPHLTIAAGLKAAKFEEAWRMLAPLELRHEERVGEVVLLKRLLRAGEQYGRVRSFRLG